MGVANSLRWQQNGELLEPVRKVGVVDVHPQDGIDVLGLKGRLVG